MSDVGSMKIRHLTLFGGIKWLLFSHASRRRLALKLTWIRFRIAHDRFKDKLADSHFAKQTYSGGTQIDHFERQWAVPPSMNGWCCKMNEQAASCKRTLPLNSCCQRSAWHDW